MNGVAFPSFNGSAGDQGQDLTAPSSVMVNMHQELEPLYPSLIDIRLISTKNIISYNIPLRREPKWTYSGAQWYILKQRKSAMKGHL